MDCVPVYHMVRTEGKSVLVENEIVVHCSWKYSEIASQWKKFWRVMMKKKTILQVTHLNSISAQITCVDEFIIQLDRLG
jgi:hypothetical protein